MTARPLLIALTGHAGAGKDTAASFLVSAAGYQAIAFADALRREVAAAWRIDHRMLTDRATKEWPVPALAAGNCGEPGFVAWCNDSGHSLTEPRSARWVMQNWGSWVRRRQPNHYAMIVAAWARRRVGFGWRRLVVTDLRYPNEEAARRARKYGGSLGTATQSADDYYGSAQMEAAFNCSDWVFLLRQKPESIEMLDRKGRLTMTNRRSGC